MSRIIPTNEYELALEYFQESAIGSQRGFACLEWQYVTKKHLVTLTKCREHEVVMIVPLSKLVAAIADRQPSLF
jgi:hypothetical protein